jgi:site-specific DNA-methyltransferase (adenine-specific)
MQSELNLNTMLAAAPCSAFSASTSEWATPQDFFDKLNAEFRFTLDAASTHENAKCVKHYTVEDDGLKQSWTGETVWLNPPYTSGPRCAKVIRAWVEKAYMESQYGATVVCLVPARTDSVWWHEYAIKGEIRFVRGRLKFQTTGGKSIRPVTPSVADGRHAPNNCAPFASAVVIFRPNARGQTPSEER